MPSRPVRQQVEFDSRCPDQMGGAKKQEKTEIFVLSLVAKLTHDLHCHLILYLVNEKKLILISSMQFSMDNRCLR